jgi:HAD superfamily hydrolase (TIGR01549 family)
MTIPRAVLLDLDNTVYAYQPCHAAGLLAASRLGAELSTVWSDTRRFERDYAAARQSVKEWTGPRAARHCRLLYFKVMIEGQSGRTEIDTTRRLHEAYWQGYFSAMVLDPGCLDMLRDLRSRAVRLAWVSNFTTERQMLKLLALGLERAADFLLTSEEAGAEKPDFALLDLALARLHVAPGEAWLIGDDFYDDVGAARARGLTAVWLRREEGEPAPGSADIVVRDWHELRDLCRL